MTKDCKNRRPKTTVKAIQAMDRQTRALQLRRSGATLAEIADHLDYAGPSSARYAIETAMAKTLREEASVLRALEGERLDRMQLGLWPAAIAGDVQAVDSVLKIMARRARLFALDAPKPRQGEHHALLGSMAEVVAKKYGLHPAEIVAEAERILAEFGYDA